MSRSWLRKLDEKDRLLLPSSVRKRLGLKHLVLVEECNGALVVRPYEGEHE